MNVLERIDKGEVTLAVGLRLGMAISPERELRDEIMKLAKLGQRMQWVSVADRLPDVGEKVDVWVAKGYCSPGRVSDMVLRADEEYRWFELGDLTFDVGDEVTHWMPLPPNPGE